MKSNKIDKAGIRKGKRKRYQRIEKTVGK